MSTWQSRRVCTLKLVTQAKSLCRNVFGQQELWSRNHLMSQFHLLLCCQRVCFRCPQVQFVHSCMHMSRGGCFVLILVHLWVMCMLLVMLAKTCNLQNHRVECYVSMQNRLGLPHRTERCTAISGKMPMCLKHGSQLTYLHVMCFHHTAQGLLTTAIQQSCFLQLTSNNP